MSERNTASDSLDLSSEFDLFAPWSGPCPPEELLEDPSTPWVPPMDVCEGNDQFTITLELAGGRKDDVTLEIRGNVVAIRGEKRSEREYEEEQPCYIERSYGTFFRSVSLPSKANGDAIHATFADGVLTIAIPKQKEKQARTIAVK